MSAAVKGNYEKFYSFAEADGLIELIESYDTKNWRPFFWNKITRSCEIVDITVPTSREVIVFEKNVYKSKLY